MMCKDSHPENCGCHPHVDAIGPVNSTFSRTEVLLAGTNIKNVAGSTGDPGAQSWLETYKFVCGHKSGTPLPCATCAGAATHGAHCMLDDAADPEVGDNDVVFIVPKCARCNSPAAGTQPLARNTKVMWLNNYRQ